MCPYHVRLCVVYSQVPLSHWLEQTIFYCLAFWSVFYAASTRRSREVTSPSRSSYTVSLLEYEIPPGGALTARLKGTYVIWGRMIFIQKNTTSIVAKPTPNIFRPLSGWGHFAARPVHSWKSCYALSTCESCHNMPTSADPVSSGWG